MSLKIFIVLWLVLMLGCASNNPIDNPRTQQELDLWMAAESLLAEEERKTSTLWMYSTGSFALFSLGLAVVAFWASKRLSGLALMVGGILGMASVWVFDSDWFPWVAGGSVGLVLLSGLAFSWVNAYRIFLSPPKPPEDNNQ
jgi:hypothetical protein